MNAKIYSILKKVYFKYPFLQPYMSFFNSFIEKKIPPKFSGWGMTTMHELPWIGGEWSTFLKTSKDIKNKKLFIHTFESQMGINSKTVDILLWRHWIVTFCIRYIFEFSNIAVKELNFVECGVGDGLSALFALNEIDDMVKKRKLNDFFMHLYDSWGPMKKEYLLKDESSLVNSYVDSSIGVTKKNLIKFVNNTVYHRGYIPDSLYENPKSPDSLLYLHIDLNSAKPTLSALDFFYPRISRGGIILFDDYGWESYKSTKKIVDTFFSDKPGILMKLPTGQAIYFR